MKTPRNHKSAIIQEIRNNRTNMKQKTAIEELLSLIPSGQDIMAYIVDNDPDEKMLDEWLWERIWKDRDWIGKNREQIEEANDSGWQTGTKYKDGADYYQQKYEK